MPRTTAVKNGFSRSGMTTPTAWLVPTRRVRAARLGPVVERARRVLDAQAEHLAHRPRIGEHPRDGRDRDAGAVGDPLDGGALGAGGGGRRRARFVACSPTRCSCAAPSARRPRQGLTRCDVHGLVCRTFSRRAAYYEQTASN